MFVTVLSSYISDSCFVNVFTVSERNQTKSLGTERCDRQMWRVLTAFFVLRMRV